MEDDRRGIRARIRRGPAMIDDTSWRRGPVAVMASGGPDSAILIGELAATSPRVVPIYVRFGTTWDREEEENLRRYLRLLSAPSVNELKTFTMPVREVYGRHWSTTGEGVPDAASEDSAVFLPGRNLLVVAQAAIWCHLDGVPTLALGLLRGNPFPDSTPEFFAGIEQVANRAVDGSLRIVCP